jgi:hypothetical protein
MGKNPQPIMISLRRSTYTVSFAVLFLFSTLLLCSNAFQMLPVAAGAWMWYKSMLTSHPLLTKSLTSSCIMSLSDVLCQELVNTRSSAIAIAGPKGRRKERSTSSTSSRLDLHRTLQVAITGMMWSGPITHFWYALLEKIYAFLAKLLHIHHQAVGLCIKLLLDAILFSPTVVVGYFVVRSLLEGGDWTASAKDKLQTKFKPTLLSAWKFWPVVNSVNFYFVPLQFRVLYMNVLSLFWSGYLTYVNSAQLPVAPPKTKEK